MGMLDIWSLITGVAGILSFLLAAWDKFPTWRRYLMPIGVFLGGFAMGRLSPVIGESARAIGGAPQTAGSVTIIFVMAVVALIYLVFMLKKGQPGLAYIGVIFIFSMAVPTVLKSYSDVAFKTSPSEYLLLAAGYEQRQDYDNSIKYLERYMETTQDNEEKELIKKKVSQLKRMRMPKISPEQEGARVGP